MNIRCDQLLDAVAAAQAQGTLRTFRGIKYSDADLHILANCIHGNGGVFDVAYGKDEQMLGALAMGAKGFVGSTYNYSGRVSNQVIELWGKGAFGFCFLVFLAGAARAVISSPTLTPTPQTASGPQAM